ncbi:hypothetical protein WIS52_14885 [Pseudonocardia nematodicida]|uniref:PE-PGRS family protein n=1 Tax=Pseudonocardia nematodicida TaxID=1206997 RepID=A0ABV1KBA0_9PSEU
MVAEVVAAGGRLEFGDKDRAQPIYKLTELVRHVNRFSKAPDGQRLQLERIRPPGLDWRTPVRYILFFEQGPESREAPLQPVPVPGQVRRYHPAVRQLRGDQKHPSGVVAARRWRILHAIAVEAEHRGYEVTAYALRSDRDLRSRHEVWDLLLMLDGETVPLGLSQENDRVEHVPTARELAEKQRYSWTRIPTHDTVPSDRLRLDVGGLHGTERQSFWADRKRWSLEEKLPEALREVAVRIDELGAKRAARAQAEVAHQEAVEQERVRARERAAESHRKELLDRQLERWRDGRELRAFAADLEARIEAAEGSPTADDRAIAEARRWLAWIEERAAYVDPLTDLPGWPEAPDLPLYQLEKFMRRIPEPIEMHYRPRRYD